MNEIKEIGTEIEKLLDMMDLSYLTMYYDETCYKLVYVIADNGIVTLQQVNKLFNNIKNVIVPAKWQKYVETVITPNNLYVCICI